MGFPIVSKTIEQLDAEIIEKAKQSKEKKGLALDPSKLFYTRAEKGLRKPSRISFETLKRMSKSCSVARLAINTLKHEVVKTKWAIVPVDPKKVPDRKKVKELEQFFNFPNEDENLRTFLLKFVEDLLVMDAGTIELVKNAGGTLAEMYHIDGATIKPAIDVHGQLIEPAYLQFMPLNNTAKPDAEFNSDELIYVMQNPQGDIKNYGYGLSPLEGVIMVATNILNADNYNGSFFEVGTLPPLLINLGDDMAQSEVEAFRAYWKAEIEGKPWKTAFLGGAGKPEVMKLQDTSNRDMQFMEYQLWLSRLMTAAYEISPQDIGITMDINKATAETQREISKAKGYRMILELIKETFTQKIIWKNFGYTDLMFDWQDVDLADALARAQVFAIEASAGAVSINEYRKEIGKDPIKGGIQPYISSPAGPIYIDATPIDEMDQETVNFEGEEKTKAPQEVKSEAKKETAKNIHKSIDIKQIALSLGIDFDQSACEYDFREFKIGMKEELEHKDVTEGDPKLTAKIVIAHLNEDSKYYTKIEEALEKTVHTGKYICWMDDRGFGQPFAWSDELGDIGYYIKPPVAVNLNGPDYEDRITHEMAAEGLNVIVTEKVPYRTVVSSYLPSTLLKTQFEEYRSMSAEYYSRKWESKWGKSRAYSFYIVSEYKKGFTLTEKQLTEDMKRDPISYRQAIRDLAELYKYEKANDLGDRRANQYLVTADKRAFGFDYQFQGGDSHNWSEYEDAIPNALKEIPELKELFLSLVSETIKKKASNRKDIMNKANSEAIQFYDNITIKYEKKIARAITQQYKKIYEDIILPQIKEIANKNNVQKDWTGNVKDGFSRNGEKYLILTAPLKNIYKDIFKEGIGITPFLMSNSLEKPHLETPVRDALTDKTPTMVTNWQKTASDRLDAVSISQAKTLENDVMSYLTDAKENGLTFNDMATGIQNLLGLEDDWRSLRIAKTEAVWAAKEGIKNSTQELGINQYEVLFGGDPCEDCIATFGDGQGPFTEDDINEIPLHPNCECTPNPIIPDDWQLEDYLDDGEGDEEEKSIEYEKFKADPVSFVKEWITTQGGVHLFIGEDGKVQAPSGGGGATSGKGSYKVEKPDLDKVPRAKGLTPEQYAKYIQKP